MGSEVIGSNLSKVTLKETKDVFTAKINGRYHGVIRCGGDLYLTHAVFESALQAANKARNLKKLYFSNVSFKSPSTSKKMTKLAEKPFLFTKAEMASKPDLKFREVWVVQNPNGEYLATYLKNNTVAKYSLKREEAELFNTYEEAQMKANTLDMLVQRGHKLKKFLVDKLKR